MFDVTNKRDAESVPMPLPNSIAVFKNLEGKIQIKEDSGTVRDATPDEMEKLQRIFGAKLAEG